MKTLEEKILLTANRKLRIAYKQSKNLDCLDFNDCIGEGDVKEITEFCRENSINEFTVSVNSNKVVFEFVKNGCTIKGMTTVNYDGCEEPAFIIGVCA